MYGVRLSQATAKQIAKALEDENYEEEEPITFGHSSDLHPAKGMPTQAPISAPVSGGRVRWTWVKVPRLRGSYPLPPEGGWTASEPTGGWWYDGEESTAPPEEETNGAAYFWGRLI